MSERLTITPLGPWIGAQISGLDVTRPLSDNQFEQLYHAVLRHQVVFLREQAVTPQQQRAVERSRRERRPIRRETHCCDVSAVSKQLHCGCEQVGCAAHSLRRAARARVGGGGSVVLLRARVAQQRAAI